MIQGTIRFHKGVFKLPLRIQLFLVLLMSANMLAPLYFINEIEAKVVLATFMVSATLMFLLTGIFGFKRILGLGHILWFPLLYFISTRLALYEASDPFGMWLRLLIAINAIALIFDTIDVIRYLRGERNEMVEDL
jgi:hypothetical protein